MAQNLRDIRLTSTRSGGHHYVRVLQDNKVLKSFGRATNRNYLQANAFRVLYIAFQDWLDHVLEDSYKPSDAWLVALEQFGPHLGRDLINKSIRDQFGIEEITVSITDSKTMKIPLILAPQPLD